MAVVALGASQRHPWPCLILLFPSFVGRVAWLSSSNARVGNGGGGRMGLVRGACHWGACRVCAQGVRLGPWAVLGGWNGLLSWAEVWCLGLHFPIHTV